MWPSTSEVKTDIFIKFPGLKIYLQSWENLMVFDFPAYRTDSKFKEKKISMKKKKHSI